MHDFIAEVGTSHLGSFDEAKRIIDEVAHHGATTVKFQWVIADEIVSNGTGDIVLPNGSTNIYEYFASVERPPEFYAELKQYAEKCGLDFLCSVFGLDSLHHLLQLNPRRIKIASPEINHIILLEELAKYPVDVILSSGVASFIDIFRAVNILRKGNVRNITVLKCVTRYPSHIFEYHVSTLERYNSLFMVDVGISDHTLEPTVVPAISAAFGSTLVEKHFTLRKTDKVHKCPDDPIALSPKEFLTMVETVSHVGEIYNKKGKHASIALVKEMYGDDVVNSVAQGVDKEGQAISSSGVLLPYYFTTRRSLFSNSDISINNKLTANDVTLKRTEHNVISGIPTECFRLFIDKIVTQPITQNMPIYFHQFL